MTSIDLANLDLARLGIPQWAKTGSQWRDGPTGEPDMVLPIMDTVTADRCGWCGSTVPLTDVASQASTRAVLTVQKDHWHALAIETRYVYPRQVDIRLCRRCTAIHKGQR